VLDCTSCRTRHPREIVLEVIRAIERGVHQAAPDAAVIAWTWSWDMIDPPPQAELIRQLPPSVIVMSDMERGGELAYGGRVLPVDEYSLTYVGPSPRCRDQLALARRHGRRAMVRLQINNTVEMATAPNLPVVANLFRKLRAVHELGFGDMLAGWNFGCRTDTVNVSAATRFFSDPSAGDETAFLSGLAADYFGLAHGDDVARVWRAFGQAMQPYPFTFSFLYFGVFNCSLVYPLPDHEPRTRSMKVWNFDSDGHGDRLEESLPPLSLAGMCARLRALWYGWSSARADYEQALHNAARADRATAELNVSRYVEHLAHSAWVIYTWFAWRYHRHAVPNLDVDAVRHCLAGELNNLGRAGMLLASDPRLGFYEEDATYYVTPQKIRDKRIATARLLERLETAD